MEEGYHIEKYDDPIKIIQCHFRNTLALGSS